MVNYIVGALCCVPIAFIIGRMQTWDGGARGVAAAYALRALTLGLASSTYTFLKWRRICHAA